MADSNDLIITNDSVEVASPTESTSSDNSDSPKTESYSFDDATRPEPFGGCMVMFFIIIILRAITSVGEGILYFSLFFVTYIKFGGLEPHSRNGYTLLSDFTSSGSDLYMWIGILQIAAMVFALAILVIAILKIVDPFRVNTKPIANLLLIFQSAFLAVMIAILVLSIIFVTSDSLYADITRLGAGIFILIGFSLISLLVTLTFRTVEA